MTWVFLKSINFDHLNKMLNIPSSKKFIAILFISIVAGCGNWAVANDFKMYFDFAFDTTEDNQNARILDYRLKANEDTLIEEDQKISQAVGGLRGTHINIFDHTPTNLYVQWKNSSTGQIYERSVDLRGKLPENIDGCTIYLMFVNDQLQVYLASTQRRTEDEANIGPLLLRRRKIQLIYSK